MVKNVIFQTTLDEFLFLGVENVITSESDFGLIWNNFFEIGGFDKIRPYQKSSISTNIWYTDSSEQSIYFSGLMVEGIDKAPEGYTLKKFPACEFLVVTTEWLPTSDDTFQHINHDYYKNAQLPDGYRKCDLNDTPITLMERENFNTENGSRYEFWLPIKKI